MRLDDTIFALSSGAPPAGIAVIRISGSSARDTLAQLAGALPAERRIALRALRDRDGDILDHALVHWARGPRTATGEDLVELHVHGGRAIIAAVLKTLDTFGGLRPAEPGEFTRRAFANGCIDLAEAEALGDLLAAETEAQRKSALRQIGGGFARLVGGWRRELLGLAARIEARIEFGEDDEVALDQVTLPVAELDDLSARIASSLAAPPAERLRDGIRVVIAGPPNAGKSTLLNALAGRDAAIVSDVAGTTRDIVEAPTVIGGLPFVLCDTAGLHASDNPIEREGMRRAQVAIEGADILLWLDRTFPAREDAVRVHAKADLEAGEAAPAGAFSVAATTGMGMGALIETLVQRGQALLPSPDQIALNQRQRRELAGAAKALSSAAQTSDELIAADHVRVALAAFDRAVGASTTEDMLDALFGSFCIGK